MSPSQAEDLVNFMIEIWDNPIIESTDTHIRIAIHPWYDARHDAVKAAKHHGAYKRWANKVAGEPGATYQFPDGSRVNIFNNGAAIKVVNRRNPNNYD